MQGSDAMKSFGAYISRRLASFAAFIFALFLGNALLFGLTFRQVFAEDYGESSPRAMLEMAAASAAPTGISETARQELRQHHIWAAYLDQDGQALWSLDLPEDVPQRYTLQDVALFSRGYIADYPVFVWCMDNGLLLLGYPKDSYTKLTSNYYSLRTVKMLPAFAAGLLMTDLLLLFLAYCCSKRKILQSTGPVIAAIEALAGGRPVSLQIRGELSAVADSVNRAAALLSRQNEARANWISGISHDIRTPLSVIMGYAERIAGDPAASRPIREQAGIVRRQSAQIKELVQDLNLVSQLEYEMQPLHKEPVRLSRLIRSCAADLVNTGAYDAYPLEIEISPEADAAVLECDPRLVSRAINNLVQNSIKHNPQGCTICLGLENTGHSLLLTVADNGIGLSPEKLRELEEGPHSMESAGDRLDLRHGLGLLLVRQIAAAHHGSLTLQNTLPCGCRAVIAFPT